MCEAATLAHAGIVVVRAGNRRVDGHLQLFIDVPFEVCADDLRHGGTLFDNFVESLLAHIGHGIGECHNTILVDGCFAVGRNVIGVGGYDIGPVCGVVVAPVTFDPARRAGRRHQIPQPALDLSGGRYDIELGIQVIDVELHIVVWTPLDRRRHANTLARVFGYVPAQILRRVELPQTEIGVTRPIVASDVAQPQAPYGSRNRRPIRNSCRKYAARENVIGTDVEDAVSPFLIGSVDENAQRVAQERVRKQDRPLRYGLAVVVFVVQFEPARGVESHMVHGTHRAHVHGATDTAFADERLLRLVDVHATDHIGRKCVEPERAGPFRRGDPASVEQYRIEIRA